MRGGDNMKKRLTALAALVFATAAIASSAAASGVTCGPSCVPKAPPPPHCHGVCTP